MQSQLKQNRQLNSIKRDYVLSKMLTPPHSSNMTLPNLALFLNGYPDPPNLSLFGKFYHSEQEGGSKLCWDFFHSYQYIRMIHFTCFVNRQAEREGIIKYLLITQLFGELQQYCETGIQLSDVCF